MNKKNALLSLINGYEVKIQGDNSSFFRMDENARVYRHFEDGEVRECDFLQLGNSVVFHIYRGPKKMIKLYQYLGSTPGSRTSFMTDDFRHYFCERRKRLCRTDLIGKTTDQFIKIQGAFIEVEIW